LLLGGLTDSVETLAEPPGAVTTERAAGGVTGDEYGVGSRPAPDEARALAPAVAALVASIGDDERMTNRRDTAGLQPARRTTDTTGSLIGTLLEICTEACKACEPGLVFTRIRDGSIRVSP